MVRSPRFRVWLRRIPVTPTSRAPNIWVVTLAIALAGCTFTESARQDMPTSKGEPQKRPVTTAPPAAKPVEKAGPPDSGTLDPGEAVTTSLPPEDKMIKPDLPPLDGLVGLGPEAVAALFGPPAQTLEEAPARTWTFREGDCILRVSFYPDLETLDYRVLSYRVGTAAEESAEQDDDATQRCRDSFRAKLATPGGPTINPAPAAGQDSG